MCFLLTTSSLAWTLMLVCTSIYIHIYIFIYIYTYISLCIWILDIGRNMQLCVCWWGDGMACGGPWWPSRALVVLYRMLLIFACYVLTYVWDAVSIFNPLPRMFLSTDFAFRITDWTCCHGPQYLHAILRIINRGVSGLTDSPCGVWGRGWTTCPLHDSPHFGSHFKLRVGM